VVHAFHPTQLSELPKDSSEAVHVTDRSQGHLYALGREESAVTSDASGYASII